MDAEVRSVRRHFHFKDTQRDGALTFQTGVTRDKHEFVLALSGVGQANAALAAERLLSDFPLTAVISFGVAGALADSFTLGQIAIATSVIESPGGRVDCDPELSQISGSVIDELGFPRRFATSLTVSHVVSDPADKARLHRDTGAEIVEMESYAIGKAASAAGVPFAVLRAISDLDETRLPDFSKFMQEYVISGRRLAVHLATHPRDLPPLLHFFSVTSAASARFARIFERLIPRIAERVLA
jgi:adenosylhomocysteine nucleosidase